MEKDQARIIWAAARSEFDKIPMRVDSSFEKWWKEEAFNLDVVAGSFPTVADSKATDALQFYEDCVDNLPFYQTSQKDNGFDWDKCRAFCRVGGSYSHQRFMKFVALWFGTTVLQMKLQWRNVRYNRL